MKKGSIHLLFFLSIVLAACSNSSQTTEQTDRTTSPSTPSTNTAVAPASKVPVQLHFHAEIYTAEVVQELIVDPLKKKFPNVSITITRAGTGTQLTDLITSGKTPDMLFVNNFALKTKVRDFGFDFDLAPLFKKYNFDVNRLRDGVIPTVTELGNGIIPALPMFIAPHVLIYNKEIFNRFGVPYPKDGMSWDEAYELAKRVTRTDGGVQYRGMEINFDDMMSRYNQLSVPIVDKKTMKASANNDQWKHIFENFNRFYTIPGNKPTAKSIIDVQAPFLTEKTLAMRVGSDQIYNLKEAVAGGLDFDYATLPTYTELPGTTIQLLLPMLAISKVSKHQDLLFEIISYLLSNEVQERNSRLGYPSVLKDTAVDKDFAKDLPWMNGKNVQALVSPKNASIAPLADLNLTQLFIILKKHFASYALDQKDINTALRQADEEINQSVQEELALKLKK
jgi:multiple sugar transport system substrate-binding protein